MKRVIALVLTVVFSISLAACGNGNADTPGSSAAPIPSNSNALENTPDVSAPSSVPPSVEDETISEYYFKDNVLQTKDVRIEITDVKIQKEKYSDADVIAFWYTVTNLKTDDTVTPMEWMFYFEAIQDNDPNVINTLQVGLLPDDQFLDSQTDEIKPGGSAPCAVAYELSDLTTPVILKAAQLLGEDLGEQAFPLDALLQGGASGPPPEEIEEPNTPAPTLSQEPPETETTTDTTPSVDTPENVPVSTPPSDSETVFSPKDVSDETIKSISTYADYLVMYRAIIEDYLANYEAAIKDTILYSAESFAEMKKQYEEAFEQQEIMYSAMGKTLIIGKDTLVDFLIQYRDSLKEYTDTIVESLG